MNFSKIEFECSFGISSQLPPSDLPEISFAGRSNVGKSSLINLIFNRKKLAKVSQTPGKTSTINFFKNDKARFVDLPGYGYAKVAKSEKQRWSELIEGYYNQERNFALVCSLIDIRHKASALDESMVRFLQDAQLPFALICTKGDKLSQSKAYSQKNALRKQLNVDDNCPMIITSSLSKQGILEVRDLISSAIKDYDY